LAEFVIYTTNSNESQLSFKKAKLSEIFEECAMFIKWMTKWWWISLPVIPAIVGVFTWLPITNIGNGSDDGWLGFWGGYLGAIITIYGVYLQIHSEREMDIHNRKQDDENRKEEQQRDKEKRAEDLILQRLNQNILSRPHLLLTYQDELLQKYLTWNRLYYTEKGDCTSGFVLENNGKNNIYNVLFYAKNNVSKRIISIPVIKSGSSVAIKIGGFDTNVSHVTELGYRFETERYEKGYALINDLTVSGGKILKPSLEGYVSDNLNINEDRLLNDDINIKTSMEIENMFSKEFMDTDGTLNDTYVNFRTDSVSDCISNLK
jgi:hypothetical protein